jgi:hypothetical protein
MRPLYHHRCERLFDVGHRGAALDRGATHLLPCNLVLHGNRGDKVRCATVYGPTLLLRRAAVVGPRRPAAPAPVCPATMAADAHAAHAPADLSAFSGGLTALWSSASCMEVVAPQNFNPIVIDKEANMQAVSKVPGRCGHLGGLSMHTHMAV